MKVWELHTSLARSIGDPIIKSDGTLYSEQDALNDIPLLDGVRYTKSIRDDYLNRAMLHVQFDILKNLIPLPRNTITRLLQRLFTQMGQTYTTNININGQPDNQIFIYNILLYSKKTFPYNEGSPVFIDPMKTPTAVIDKEWNIRNLPIMDETSMANYVGSNTNILPDLTAYITTRGGFEYFGLAGKEIEHLKSLSDEAAKPEDVVKLEISYFKRADDVSNLLPNDYVPFEEIMLPYVLNRAIMMSHVDSGEMGSVYQAIPFIESMQMGVQKDATT